MRQYDGQHLMLAQRGVLLLDVIQEYLIDVAVGRVFDDERNIHTQLRVLATELLGCLGICTDVVDFLFAVDEQRVVERLDKRLVDDCTGISTCPFGGASKINSCTLSWIIRFSRTRR